MIDDFTGDHYFLSNFYEPAPVVLDGQTYPTTEHAYQAAKTDDEGEREAIRRAPTPGDAKRLGRRVSLRPEWEDVRDGVMLDLCRQKFRDPDLRRRLLDTGDHELVEGNWWGDVYWDVYWGVCKGVGQNRLGLTLMRVRDEIRSGCPR